MEAGEGVSLLLSGCFSGNKNPVTLVQHTLGGKIKLIHTYPHSLTISLFFNKAAY